MIPAAARPATVNDLPLIAAMKFTGLETSGAEFSGVEYIGCITGEIRA